MGVESLESMLIAAFDPWMRLLKWGSGDLVWTQDGERFTVHAAILSATECAKGDVDPIYAVCDGDKEIRGSDIVRGYRHPQVPWPEEVLEW